MSVWRKTDRVTRGLDKKTVGFIQGKPRSKFFPTNLTLPCGSKPWVMKATSLLVEYQSRMEMGYPMTVIFIIVLILALLVMLISSAAKTKMRVRIGYLLQRGTW